MRGEKVEKMGTKGGASKVSQESQAVRKGR